MSTSKSQALEEVITDEASADPKLRMIKRIIELLTGIEIDTIDLSRVVKGRNQTVEPPKPKAVRPLLSLSGASNTTVSTCIMISSTCPSRPKAQ